MQVRFETIECCSSKRFDGSDGSCACGKMRLVAASLEIYSEKENLLNGEHHEGKV